MTEEEFEKSHPALVNALFDIDFFVENNINEDDTYYIRKNIKAGEYERALNFIQYIKKQVYDLYWAVEKANDYIEDLIDKKNKDGQVRI